MNPEESCLLGENRYLKPDRVIPPTATVKIETRRSGEAKFSIKDVLLSKQSTEVRVREDTVIVISKGGSPERPYWFFQAVGDELLEGTAKSLLCKISPASDVCCNCQYEVVVNKGDWFYKLDVDPKLGKCRRTFAKLRMRELAMSRIAALNLAVSDLNNVFSKGGWKCPAIK